MVAIARRALAGALSRGLRNGLPNCKVRSPCRPSISRIARIIAVEGADAETFLQNIVTTDLAALGEGEARPGALLSPQGKILFDFLVSRDGDERLLLDCRAALADDFVRRLTLYRLRAKAAIAKQDQALVAVSWGGRFQAALTN